MGLRQRKWAKQARFVLMFKLGAYCACCGSEDDLTFDCIKPMGDKHHKWELSWRMSFYHAQDRAGNLQILCRGCNEEKSRGERGGQILAELCEVDPLNQPF